MPLDEIVQTATQAPVSSLDTGYLKDFQTADAGNGNTMISFSMDETAMKTYIDLLDIGINVSDYDMSFHDMSGTLVVSPEGYCLAQDVSMTMNMNMAGEIVTTFMDIHLDYINPGQPVDFTLPSTAGYTDIQ